MTAQEVQALADLLRRAPMTAAEALWASALMTRLQSLAVPDADPAPDQEQP